MLITLMLRMDLLSLGKALVLAGTFLGEGFAACCCAYIESHIPPLFGTLFITDLCKAVLGEILPTAFKLHK